MWQFTNRQLNREFDMSFRKASLVAMLAVSMASTPVLAQTANSAQRAPAATSQTARAGANVSDSNELRGGFIIPVLALLAVIGGILAATSGGGNRPTSP
jgi:hypothetical protein